VQAGCACALFSSRPSVQRASRRGRPVKGIVRHTSHREPTTIPSRYLPTYTSLVAKDGPEDEANKVRRRTRLAGTMGHDMTRQSPGNSTAGNTARHTRHVLSVLPRVPRSHCPRCATSGMKVVGGGTFPAEWQRPHFCSGYRTSALEDAGPTNGRLRCSGKFLEAI
jgi:hypothetical protein